jgi:LacI family transcriptional regulator
MERALKPPPRRIRLEDVAHQAGVSVATASLALSDKSVQYRISTDVTERVRKAARELDYTPNRLVRSMQRGQTHILSFFNGYRTRTPQDIYMNTLCTALERAAGSRGYDLLVHCDFTRSPEQIYQHLNGGIADAVLFFAPQDNDPLLALLKKSRLPTVLIGGKIEGALPQVTDDVEAGMRLVAQRLVEQGHRKIGVLYESANPNYTQRVGLLRGELALLGVTLCEDRFYTLEGIEGILKGDNPPTALFCSRDRLAYYLLDRCTKHGISVPERLSIVGYDGLPWETISGHRAASVKVDIEALAEAAVARMVAQLSGHNELPLIQYFPTTFVEGTTLGAAPTGATSGPRQHPVPDIIQR